MRAGWLEAHDEFEGVGAHELNPRYEHVDGDDWDQTTRDTLTAASHHTAFTRAQSFLATTVVPIRLDGIDVSHYQYDQGPINWAQVASVPTFWNATKLTQSTRYLDPTGDRSRKSIKAIGSRHSGLYHWLSSTTDPRLQADWFVHNVGRLAVGEFAMLDAEESGVSVASVLSWCEAVENYTHRPAAVYTGAYVSGGSIWTDSRIREGRYGMRPMILAAYTTEAKARALPGVSTHPWSSWQFSSNGPVPGVVGRCDMNRVDSVAIYDIACGLDQPAPAPLPPSIPSEDDMPAMVKNTQAHDIGDGHGPYDPGVIHWEVADGCKAHITSVAVVKAYGGTERAVGLTNAELDSIPDRHDLGGGELVESGPMSFTGTISSIPGSFTITSS